MTLPGRQERLLRRVDRALCRSDPHLASMLSVFARLTAAERMPARERLRPPPARARHVLLRPLAAAVIVVVFAAGGGASAVRRAATACMRCAQRVRGVRMVSPAAAAQPAARPGPAPPVTGPVRT